MANSNLFTSSVGRKIIVGLTGLFLITFLVVHLGCNLTIIMDSSGNMFNDVAYFMSHFWLMRIIEVGLFLGLIAHIVMTLKLNFENKSKRPVGYAVSPGNVNSTWYSRSMAILGSLLLIFLVIHLYQFWIPTKKALYITHEDEDAYTMVTEALRNPLVLLVYIIAFISLGYHLLHGFQSAFQTLGLNHKKYTPIIKKTGTAFAIIVPALFALIALVVFFTK